MQTEDINQAIASKLRGLRAERRMSREDVAPQAGMSVRTLARIEAEGAPARVDQLLAVLDVLDADPVQFLRSALGLLSGRRSA